MMNRQARVGLFIAMLSVFIDMIGVSIILPIIPFLALEFGANSQELGFIYAAYAGAQMISTPITGRLSDKYGRRPLLILSLLGSTVGFLFQGLAKSYGTFVAARAVAGMFGGSIPICQAYISDVIPVKQRPRYFAALGSVVTVAFMFGPGIGAGLAEFSLQTPMLVSAAVACCGLIAAITSFKEPVKQGARSQVAAAPAPEEEEAVSRDRTVSLGDRDGAKAGVEEGEESSHRDSAVPPANSPPSPHPANYRPLIFIMWACAHLMQLGFSAYIYYSSLWLNDRFGYESLEYGFIAMGVSVVSVVVQIGVYPRFQRRNGKHATGITGAVNLGIGLIMLTFLGTDQKAFTGLPLLCIALTFLACGFAFMTPSVTSVLSRYASHSSQGSVLGVSQSLQALARTVGPILWGSMYSSNKQLPFFISGLCALLGGLLMYIVLTLNRRLPESKDKKHTVHHAPSVTELAGMGGDELVQSLRTEIARLKARLQQYEESDGSDMGTEQMLEDMDIQANISPPQLP